MADPISADRLIYGGTWEGKVGVENGIPTNFTKSGSTINAYTGTASTINTAITNAADDTYVELGAGTFSLSTHIVINNSRVILRGQVDANGVPTTIINFTGGSGACVSLASGTGWDLSNTGTFTTRNVSSPAVGSLRGISTVTLASTPTGMTVGQLIFFSDNSQGGDDFYGFGSSGAGRTWMHWARCTIISGNDVTFSPAISADFLSGTPQCHFKAGGGTLRLSGIENLTLTATIPDDGMIELRATDECWIKNVIAGPTSGGSQVHHVNTYVTFRCQIDHCEFHDQNAYGNSSYVINAYAGGSNLVINNYIHDVANVMPIFGWHGCVFAYNYINALSYDSPNGWLSQIVFDHGAFNDYNLFEGNWCPASYNDNTASARNNVWLRNRMRGYDSDGETGITDENTNAFTQEDGYSYRVLVGNVLGENGIHDNVVRLFTTGNENDTNNIYNLNTDHDDLFIRVGNYNTVDDAVPVSEALGGSDIIVNSYLFSSKPAWFGTCPFPPIVPTNFTQSNNRLNLPAGYRAANGMDPPTDNIPSVNVSVLRPNKRKSSRFLSR